MILCLFFNYILTSTKTYQRLLLKSTTPPRQYKYLYLELRFKFSKFEARDCFVCSKLSLLMLDKKLIITSEKERVSTNKY